MNEAITQYAVSVEDGVDLGVYGSRDTGDGPILMIWPAMGVQARKYQSLQGEFLGRGITSVAVDFRGFGASRPRTDRANKVGYHETATVDFPAVVADIESRFPGRSIVLLGHSLGAQTGIMYAANAPQKLAGIAFVAANSPYFRVYPGLTALGPLVGTTMASAIAKVVGYFPGDRLRFLGRQPKHLINDWARLARTGDFNSLSAGTAYSELMRQLDLPVIGITIAGDWMAPPPALDALLAHIPAANVTRWHCDEAATGGRPAGHTSWIYRGAEVAERVVDWINLAVRRVEA